MQAVKLAFALIRQELKGEKISEEIKNLIPPEMLKRLYMLSKSHDLTHLLADALDKNGLLIDGSPERKIFMQQRNMAIYRYEQQRYEFDQICEVLTQEKIAYIPLKGSILRDYYPQAWMRTSCDIDILVKSEDLKKAMNALISKLDYSHESSDSHDESLYSPSGVHLELHYSLLEDCVNLEASKILDGIFEECVPCDDLGYRLKMSNEFFYFFHVVHMSKHILNGGCGIKPFLDLWILDENFTFDNAKLDSLLEKCNLLTFTKEARKLAEFWVNDGEIDETTRALEEYLLTGGVYGNASNRIAVERSQEGGKFKYILSRIFKPYDKLKHTYPILKKHKWLFPFCQVARWFHHLFSKDNKRVLKNFSVNASVDETQENKASELLKQLGL